MSNGNGFNGKRLRFVQEYLIDMNATRAAIRAGYSEKTAYSQGQRLLKNVEIQAALQKAMTKRSERTQVTQDQVVAELARIAFADMSAYATWGEDGVTLEGSEDMMPNQTAVVGEVSETRTKDGGTIRFKLHDKTRALELLGRHLAMFTDVQRVTGDLPPMQVFLTSDEDITENDTKPDSD